MSILDTTLTEPTDKKVEDTPAAASTAITPSPNVEVDSDTLTEANYIYPPALVDEDEQAKVNAAESTRQTNDLSRSGVSPTTFTTNISDLIKDASTTGFTTPANVAPLPLEGATETSLPPMNLPSDQTTQVADEEAAGDYELVFRKDRDTVIPVALLDVIADEAKEDNTLDLKLVTGEVFLKVQPSVTGREEGKWSIRKNGLQIKLEEFGEVWQQVLRGYDSLQAQLDVERVDKVEARRAALERELADL